jgi:hypothetical protein
MYGKFRQGTAVNYNIVKVYVNEFSCHWLQDALHREHQLAGSVRQAKWQDSPLGKAKFIG